MQLTHGPGRHQGSPAGRTKEDRSIVFDSLVGGARADIWTIGTDGSGLRQLTNHPADDNIPTWSRDGRSGLLRFHSDGSPRGVARGRQSGAEEQITQSGGDRALPERRRPDFVLSRSQNGALLGRPTAGGQERTVLPCVLPQAAVGSRSRGTALHRVRVSRSGSQTALHFWDASTGKDRVCRPVDGRRGVDGISVSPDGLEVLLASGAYRGDLMMIDNFR